MGKLQIFDLCLALDTLHINDRLFAFLDGDAGILFHSLVKCVAERGFLDDEGYRSMDGANCGHSILVGGEYKAFFFQIGLCLHGNPFFVDKNGGAVRKHQGKAKGEGCEQDIICAEI